MTIEIVPVTTRSQRREFLNLPWKLYKADPTWVPPLRGNQKQLCGFGRHPFYRNASSQAFLAKKDGATVGRILAISNREHNQYNSDQLGFFGFFESIDDSEVATALLDAARDHLKSAGHDSMRGPVNPSMNYECGLLVEGFDSPPVFMMTYNPPYYRELFEQYGLEKVQDLFAFLGNKEDLEKNAKRWKTVSRRLEKKQQFKIRAMERSRFNEELRGFLDIYNRSLVGSWGFVPITTAEVDHMAGELRYLIAPEITAVVEVEDQRIGVTFGMLDYNTRIKQIDGSLFPFGFIKLLRNKKSIKRIRILSANVIPEYQGNQGIGMALFFAIIPAIQDWGIEQCEFSWVLESNTMSKQSLERCGTERYKTYRMFEVQFD